VPGNLHVKILSLKSGTRFVPLYVTDILTEFDFHPSCLTFFTR
jgi:hypothetical protein